MVDQRPFSTITELHAVAREVWLNLDQDDWLEAFSAHPKIGDRHFESGPPLTNRWAQGEQSGTQKADAEVRRRLAEANEAYSARFGFIFIISATGKSAVEMLANLESRLENDRETEVRIAADQQAHITELRLNKLLNELGDNE